jgi:hypothetical protein
MAVHTSLLKDEPREEALHKPGIQFRPVSENVQTEENLEVPGCVKVIVEKA